MGVGSGLGAQLVVGQESSYGTGGTLDHSYEFDSESIARNVTWLMDDALAGGLLFPRATRTRESTREAAGSIPLSFVTNKMGLWVKNILGSATVPTQISTSTAYEQVHTPGANALTGVSAVVQVGRPRTDGTVDPFTYSGGKITQAVLTCTPQQLLKLALDMNFKDVTTATGLAAFAPVATARTFSWKDASLTMGGTASTSSGKVTVAGGTPIASLVTGVTLTMPNPQNVGRYGLGGAGTKSEPLPNAKASGYSLALQAEYTNRAELYDAFVAAGNTPVVLTFDSGVEIGTSGSNYLVEFILSAAKIKQASPTVSGPDVLPQQATLDAESDGTNAPIQIRIVSDDTSL